MLQLKRKNKGREIANNNISSRSDDLRDLTTRGAVAAIAVAVLVIAVSLSVLLFGGTGNNQPNDDRFQVVYLNTGEVYFGKLGGVNSPYLVLTNAFRVSPNASPSPGVNAVSVSDLVYGPSQTLQLNRENVLFWQDLKSDSQAAKAIEAKVGESK